MLTCCIASYGPAGEEIILNTLRYHVFPTSKESSGVLEATMADAAVAEESSDAAAFWKGFRPSSLSLTDFIHFIAGPFVTNLLISKDRLITEAEADVVRLESIGYGKTVHTVNDAVDDLAMRIAAPQRVDIYFLIHLFGFLT